MLSKVNTTDGLWICCSLSMFSWDFEEQQLLLLRHVMAKTVAKRAENMKVSASLKATIFAKPHVGVVSQHKLLIHATSNSTVFTQLSGLAKNVSNRPQRWQFHERCGYNLTEFNTAINRTGTKAFNPMNYFPLPCSCSEKDRHLIMYKLGVTCLATSGLTCHTCGGSIMDG